jgi:DnaA family protein
MKNTQQLALSVQLPDDETFQSYQSSVNQNVVEHLTQFVKQLSQMPTESKTIHGFYLFGIEGVGKSHLLHASCALANELNKSSVCLSFSELQHLSVEVLDGLEHIDLVCLDDVHLIAGKDNWQRAVFDLYNRLAEQNHCLLVTGDKTVNDLSFSLADLTSRLSWGYVEPVKPLSDDEKLHAIIFRAQQRGLFLGEDVANFLMTRLSRDMKSLLTGLDKLDNASIREQRKITIPFIKEVLFS